MAKRSATECAAILDVFGRLELADKSVLVDGKDELDRIVAMLVKLTRSVT